MFDNLNIISEIGLSAESTISSLNYARTIQDAILCNRDGLKRYFGEFGLIYSPKNILSGDMYFYYRKKNFTYLAVCDCTGHGVSGALLTILCHNMLERTLKKYTELEDIFHHLNRHIKNSFSKESQEHGMDMVMVRFQDNESEIQFCGAYRPLWLLKQDQLLSVKGDRCSIGSCEAKFWSVHNVSLKQGDKLLLFSDGIVDQFCKNNSKKFGVRRLKNVVVENRNLTAERICDEIYRAVSVFKGESIQTDDNILLCLEY